MLRGVEGEEDRSSLRRLTQPQAEDRKGAAYPSSTHIIDPASRSNELNPRTFDIRARREEVWGVKTYPRDGAQSHAVVWWRREP
eukprot:scaffold137445_cov99-Phaeocystis_antarctica.AAC.1